MRIAGRRISWWALGMAAIVILAIALRLKGIHHPILDHPAWRQGDTASIARNFARLNFNLLYPQTNYNGPPPNYVELELQIVPYLAASLYRIFGVHEIFGRLITLFFSVGTVGIIGLFARWLFAPIGPQRYADIAGLAAALFFAIVPGSVYYGRTFTPDATMVFFLTAALYAATRLLVEDERLAPRPLARATALVAVAYLAKPVAVAGIVPLIGVMWERLRAGRTTRLSALAVMLIVPLIILWSYDQHVAEHAEWHWASGITTLHVLPALKAAFTSTDGFAAKLAAFRQVIGMLRTTMLGTTAFLLSVAGFVALPWIQARSKAVLWGWLAGGLAYTYAVVTVERVDYYMFLLLPLAALVIGGLIARVIAALDAANLSIAPRFALYALLGVLPLVALINGRAAVASYYAYPKALYRNAVFLKHTLDPHALVVIGHYGPDVLYAIDRYGWEEDPKLWTPFDEESAIRKGARYFISIEDNRLRANLELCAWLQRFPVLSPNAQWPVYVTDPAHERPHADTFWQAFRTAERTGNGRRFLNQHHLCEDEEHGVAPR